MFNESIDNYTLKEEINGVKSIKKVPIKFKIDDKTARFRKELLKEELLKN